MVQLLSNYFSRLMQVSNVPIYDNTILYITTYTNEYGCLRPSGWNPARRIYLCVCHFGRVGRGIPVLFSITISLYKFAGMVN